MTQVNAVAWVRSLAPEPLHAMGMAKKKKKKKKRERDNRDNSFTQEIVLENAIFQSQDLTN